ncbi:hypothetical protein QQS21_002551 [Conoideocrella luteorostrata]|uniref:N-acetyltransferase domain-containing protein n=1 Tax=Conoideocrella luteorostrata TaxID=1105319 RepID=A0AAJ0FX43_9HYPO|nr:hypothetical protein QQS21_002551 [Conoideocrella luteorostrata]
MDGNRLCVVRSAISTDAEAIASVHYNALQLYHDFYAAFFVNHPRILISTLTKQALQDARNIFLVAVDRANQNVLGFIRYNIVDPNANTLKLDDSRNPAVIEQDNAALLAPKPHLEEIWQRIQDTEAHMDKCYESSSRGQKHACKYSDKTPALHQWVLTVVKDVKHLMVDSSFQRRGIGRLLLQAALSATTQHSIPTYIVSSRDSHGLYRQLGFQDLASRRIDNEAWVDELIKLERSLGIPGDYNLLQTYRGVVEDESLMMRSDVQ